MTETTQKFQHSINRTRNTARRLISANFDAGDAFLTLTFARNVEDLALANSLFKSFIRSLRITISARGYDPEKFKYFAVIEFQKRGAVHYHVLLRVPYLDIEDYQALWPYGWFKINRIQHVRNVGLYVSKYMRKDISDPRLRGKRSYQCSRNLIRPVVITDKDFVRPVLSNAKRSASLVYKSSFDNQHTGKVHYRLLRRDK
ncbi:MAG: replication initiator [Candidatus Moraniibacteriota bacterium]